MSDLFKKMHQNKGKPPKSKDNQNESDEEDNEEELKDQFIESSDKSKVFEIPKGPIKATIPIKGQSDLLPNKKIKSNLDYTPVAWSEYFDSVDYTEKGTAIYTSGQTGPIFVCLHGLGFSSESFCLLAREIKSWAILIAFDFRGHGRTKITENKDNLSQEILIEDTLEVLHFIDIKYPLNSIIIMGHSMGGAIACKTVEFALECKNLSKKIQGLVVIDVVEGTALEALPFMEDIVTNQPQTFKNMEVAIRWSLKTTVKKLESARVSVPPKLVEVLDENGEILKYKWKVDLLKSKPYWTGWFKGLTSSFLNVQIPKVLLVAEKERMDKELTIAQMQGKFKLVVLHNVGHVMHEDDSKNLAIHLRSMIENFKIPINKDEVKILSEIGIGNFKPHLNN